MQLFSVLFSVLLLLLQKSLKNDAYLKVTANCRVALRSDSYVLHKILPNKVDPLVSLMMVEKVPDSTYEMVGGLDKQVVGLFLILIKLFFII